MAGYPVVPPSEADGSLVSVAFADPSTTQQTIQYAGTGAKWVTLSYRLLPGATAVANQYMKVVVNASSDADAAGKLALAGGYAVLCQGDDLCLSSSGITRIDFLTAAAVGAEKTIFQALAGV